MNVSARVPHDADEPSHGPLRDVSFARILWAHDFSPCSEQALRFALPLARDYGSVLTAVHVMPATLPPGAEAGAVASPALLRPHIHHELSLSLERAVGPAREASVTSRTTLRTGDPADEILSLAAALPADLVVVGRHGHRLVVRSVLGAVAERILGRAACPVLVVPSERTASAERETIVWATDFSPHATHALGFAASLAARRAARLVLLHVVEGNLLTSEREAVRHARLRLADAVHAVREAGSDPETVLVCGSGAGEIVRVASEQGASLLVMGVQGARTLHRLFCGSTAHRVVREAPCAVLAARRP